MQRRQRGGYSVHGVFHRVDQGAQPLQQHASLHPGKLALEHTVLNPHAKVQQHVRHPKPGLVRGVREAGTQVVSAYRAVVRAGSIASCCRDVANVRTVKRVRTLIGTVSTLHNRTYFWTLYFLGLRMTEGPYLQTSDIDGARRLVHVHRGKGARDRYVPLSPRTLALLREYWCMHRHPRWLFPGDRTWESRVQGRLRGLQSIFC